MADEVPYPDMGHLAINVLEVLVSHRHPFRFSRSTRSSGVHVWFAREEDIGLAILVAFYVRTEGLKTVIYRHILLIETKEVLGSSG
jgi:hypothetical protein